MIPPLQPARDDFRRPTGWMALALAVVEQAVWDFRKLVETGAVVNNEVVDPWPIRRNARGHVMRSEFYQNFEQAEVADLLTFLKSDQLERYLAAVGSELDADYLRRGLGL